MRTYCELARVIKSGGEADTCPSAATDLLRRAYRDLVLHKSLSVEEREHLLEMHQVAVQEAATHFVTKCKPKVI